jgi:hypothetical protein
MFLNKLFAALFLVVAGFGDSYGAAFFAAAGGGGSRYDPLTDDRIARIPLLYRGDALAFCREVGPLVSTEARLYTREHLKNPYELYMEVAVFGLVLGLIDGRGADEAGKEAMVRLVSADEIDGEKGCLAAGLGLEIGDDLRSELLDSVAPLEASRRDFEGKFLSTLNRLVADHNIFAYFAMGFFEFERGLSSDGRGTSKAEGEYLLHRAADGFCGPALGVLEKIYQLKGMRDNPAEKKSRLLQSSAPFSADPREMVRFVIENDIFSNELTSKPPFASTCCRRKMRLINDLAHTDYKTKFIDNILPTFEPNQIHTYYAVQKHLVFSSSEKTLDGSVVINSACSFATNVVFPFLVLGVSSFQTYFAASNLATSGRTSTLDVGDSAQLYAYEVLLNGNAWLTLTSFVVAGRSTYGYFSRPIFTSMAGEELHYQCSLSALHYALNPDLRDGPEVRAEALFRKWLTQKRSVEYCLGCSTPQTLSYQALT